MKVEGSIGLVVVRGVGYEVGISIGYEIDIDVCDKFGEGVELEFGVKFVLINLSKMKSM